MFDQQNPVNRDGQISLSAMEAMAQQAAGVIAYPGAGTFYQSGLGQTFSQDTALVVKDDEDSVTVGNVSTISLDKTYFTVTDSGSGTATVTLVSSSTLTVAEADGSPSYTGITVIQFNSGDGFLVTNPTTNTALIEIRDASETQAGIVNIGPSQQTFEGPKAVAGTFIAEELGAIDENQSFVYASNGLFFRRVVLTNPPFSGTTDPYSQVVLTQGDGVAVVLQSNRHVLARFIDLEFPGTALGVNPVYAVLDIDGVTIHSGTDASIAGFTCKSGIITGGSLNLGGIANGTYPP